MLKEVLHQQQSQQILLSQIEMNSNNNSNQLNQIVQQTSSSNGVEEGSEHQSQLPSSSFEGHPIENPQINHEEYSYLSPKHTQQIQRMRADSNGNFHRMINSSQIALHSGGGGGSSQQSQQMIFGEQPPFFQYLAAANQPSPYYQPHVSTIADAGTHSVVSNSHPSSSIQLLNSNLLNMEPFSTQHISQSGASVIHSNFPSRKGSIRSDDSLSGSPRLTVSHYNNFQNLPTMQQRIPHYPGAFRQHYQSTLSVFSRQSTAQFKSTNFGGGGGNTATASVACNEGGPIGLREYSNAHMSTFGVREGNIGGPTGGFNSNSSNANRRPPEDDELEFKDEVLDKVHLPQIQINIQQLQIALVNQLRNVEDEVIASTSSQETDQIQVSTTQKLQSSSYLERSSPITQSPQGSPDQAAANRSATISQQAAFQEEPTVTPQPTSGTNSSYILSQSISSSTLAGNITFNNQSQGISGATEQYQPLSIEQSIWSAQIPPQTQEEFLQSTQQHTQSAGVELSLTSNQPQAQNSTLQINLSTNAQPYIPGVAQSNQATAQQYDQQPPTQQPLYQQAFEIIGQHQHVQQTVQMNQQQPQVLHQQYSSQYPQDVQLQAPHQNQQEAQYQAMIEQQQQMALNQIITQSMNHGVAQPWQMAAAMNHPHHLIGSPQIPGSTSQGLSQQDITAAAVAQAAQVEATIQQFIAATGVNPAMQNYLYEQSQQQQQQQQQLQPNQANSQNQSIFQDQHQLASGVVGPQSDILQGCCFNDPMNLHQQDWGLNTQLQQLYMNRQFNRYMRNPIYKTKSGMHHQNSFRVSSAQSPELIFPGNLSLLRPPPGFEHVVPKNPYAAQMILEQQLQMQQNATNATLQAIAYQQQQHQQAAATQILLPLRSLQIDGLTIENYWLSMQSVSILIFNIIY